MLTIKYKMIKSMMIEVICVYKKIKAAARQNVFACKALNGDSNYNICINSDMTVSCNCQDYDGSGHIGSLEYNDFESVFFGEKAYSFRIALSNRKFPVKNCWSCSELIELKKDRNEEYLRRKKMPTRGLMVENTVLCNLSCLECNRASLIKSRKKSSLSIKDVEVVADVIKKIGVEQVCFFNLGEPFMSKNICKEISILKNNNKKTRFVTSTNGASLDSPEKIDAALMFDHIYFSIDGCDQATLTKYQIGGNFDRSYENMKKLAMEREKQKNNCTRIEWKYVLFRWNDKPKYIKKAISLAKAANVDVISFWPGGARPWNQSIRYKVHPFFKSLGVKSWKGREIVFR